MTLSKKGLILALLLFGIAAQVHADTTSLLVLYTNDIHDYIKPGANNTGGLPYLSAYVASMRAQRSDILLLDGGDVMEKGDMVAFKTKSRITYEAMGTMGYAAGAVGNHDIDHGVDYLNECAKLANYAMLCLNHFDASGSLAFPASTIIEINGIKVGILGMTNIRTSMKEDGARLAAEAARLDQETHLLVVVAHIGSRECLELSAYAPEVDLFISAHTHEVLNTPTVAPDTGALVVQAGHYAQYMGHLELVVDRKAKKIVSHNGKLVLMDHATMSPDTTMLARIAEVEQQACPEASEVIGKASRFINASEMASLAAAALQERGRVDAGFCHAGQVIRSGVYPGEVDVNALFRTGGQRGRDLVIFELTGEQVAAYLAGLLQEKRGRTEWAGFQASQGFDSATKTWSATTTLKPTQKYRVIMSDREWNQRFKRVAKERPEFKEFNMNDVATADFTFTDALAVYVRKATANGETLDAHVESLLKNRGI